MILEDIQNLVEQGYNRIPVYRELLADLETPLSLYLKLADDPYSFLFESFEKGEKWGRYSIIGLPCSTLITVNDTLITVTKNGEEFERVVHADPLEWIDNYKARFNVPTLPNLPPFSGGFVGYFGYDTVRYVEPCLGPCHLPDPLKTPDILLMIADELAILDSIKNKLYLIVHVESDDPEAIRAANERLDELTHILHTRAVSLPEPPTQILEKDNFTTNISKNQFENAVLQAKEYIFAGDIMQVILSQRLETPFLGEPINFYRTLKQINPSPYLYYLNFDDFYVVGSSPEILVRVQDNEATVRPLAGTRKRGKTPEEDLFLERDLLSDTKELAEHLMLIDLGRNDIGRISSIGTVKLTEKMAIERYSHVMHIVSNISGQLKPDLDAIDALRATFPAGTLSGAAKVRAMEIIDELETVKRGVYGGAVGYLAWNGNMDIAIAIRTAVIKDKVLYIQAGAGIVADSVPESEWKETMNKARAIIVAAMRANF
jgi:anthranilate synthase component 1